MGRGRVLFIPLVTGQLLETSGRTWCTSLVRQLERMVISWSCAAGKDRVLGSYEGG